jgi:hypothetical protein
MRGIRVTRIGPWAGLLIALALPGRAIAAEGQKPLWLAVGNAELVKPLAALAEKRRGEGLQTVISTRPVDQALAASARRPDFLLLVGDDEPGEETQPWYLAAKRRKLYRWRRVQAEQFASDAAWGDLDGDLVPDVPVGRIPARTPAQVALAVSRILAYERQPPTPADLRLVVWAGSPQYGAGIDAMATGLLLLMIQTNAPAWTQPWIVSGNPLHPLCGWPPDQPALVTRQMRQGGLCTVLMGHAGPEGFFSMKHGQQGIWYTASDARAELAEGPPAPPLFLFSCQSGDFARPTPCMCESFFFFPGGPVATVGATTESHPLTNYFSGVGLLRALRGREKRIGPLWLEAQRGAMKARNLLVERVLRDVEGKLDDEINVEKLRRDQMLMYALLGDPATRLRIPDPLKARVQRTATGWRWEAERPPGATSLQVGYRSHELPFGQGAATPMQEKEARAAFQTANAGFAFTPLPPPPHDGPWEGTIDKPGWLRLVATGNGAIHVAGLKLQ